MCRVVALAGWLVCPFGEFAKQAVSMFSYIQLRTRENFRVHTCSSYCGMNSHIFVNVDGGLTGGGNLFPPSMHIYLFPQWSNFRLSKQ